MHRMRLFQLADELGTTPGDLVKQASDLDVDAPSFICLLSEEDERVIRAGFKKRSSVELADMQHAAADRIAAKAERAKARAKERIASETEALRAAINEARRLKEEKEAASAAGMSAVLESASASGVTPEENAGDTPAPLTETAEGIRAEDANEKEPEEQPAAFSEEKGPEPAAQPASVSVQPLKSQSTFLKDLPVRQMQAPRPEFSPKKVQQPTKSAVQPSKAPQKAAAPQSDAPGRHMPVQNDLSPVEKNTEKTDKKGSSAAKADESRLLRPDKNLAKAQKHQKKSLRAFVPDDDDFDDDINHSFPRNYTGPVRSGGARPMKQPSVQAVPQAKPVLPQVPSSVQNDIDAKIFKVHGPMVVKDLAAKLGSKPNLIITELMKQGVLASINQTVAMDVAIKVAEAHGFAVEQDKSRRSIANRPVFKDPAADDDIPEDTPSQLKPRPPVVTFLGHVDHGKTSLMDRIRKSNVAAGEAGGITQHIGAYTVDVKGQPITFLDTPGHAAFSAMRARGANLTDIAVIIIAADDGIMPQTKEAIQHAKNAHVTIMVAINKCDLPQANPDRVMRQLQAESLTPEEWGGDTIVCSVSAQTGEGVDHLLEMILLQAEVLELRANPDRRANGTVIEAKMEPGSGPIASVLVTGGTLKVGDVVLCGEFYGKLRAIVDVSGKRVSKIGPSMAARIMGLSGVPDAGAEFRVIPNEKRARELAEEFAENKKLEMLGTSTQAHSIDDIFKKMDDAEKLQLDIILRADVQGSVEAIQTSIEQIKSTKVSCEIIQAGTGSITSNDVQRASGGAQKAGGGKAVIIGFNVSPEPGVLSEARHNGVNVRTFKIIYELLDFVQQEMLNIIPVEHREVIKGHAQVKQIFVLNRVGVAAGSIVLDGVVSSSAKVRVLRNKKVVHTGGIASIRHYKDEVKEVSQAQECGIILSDFEDFHENDIIECFVFEELPKTL